MKTLALALATALLVLAAAPLAAQQPTPADLIWSQDDFTPTFLNSLKSVVATAAGCPITSVAVGSIADKTTWTVIYDPSCTGPEQVAGAAAVSSFSAAAVLQALDEPEQLAKGFNVSCVSVPTVCAAGVAGNYEVDQAAATMMDSYAAQISAGQGLPGGGSTFNYPDLTGMAHVLTQAQFFELYQALKNYRYAVGQVERQLLSGQSVAWPVNSAELQ